MPTIMISDLKKWGEMLFEVYNGNQGIIGVPEWHLGRTPDSSEELIQ